MFAVDRTCKSNFRRASSKQEALFESVGTWTSTSYFSKACDRAWPVGKNLAAIAVDKGTSNQMSCRRYLSSEIPCLESNEVSCNARAIPRQSASTVFLSRSFKPSLASESIASKLHQLLSRRRRLSHCGPKPAQGTSHTCAQSGQRKNA
jgi:hypothetical protein